jgi:hypothetical protein
MSQRGCLTGVATLLKVTKFQVLKKKVLEGHFHTKMFTKFLEGRKIFKIKYACRYQKSFLITPAISS